MRPALATVLGIVLTLGISLALQLAMASYLVAPDGAPLPIGRTFLSAMLGIAFGAAVIGGAVGAHVASAARSRVTLAIAIAVALFGVRAALDAPEDTPPVVAWAMPVVAFVGAMAGGAIRAMNRTARSPV